MHQYDIMNSLLYVPFVDRDQVSRPGKAYLYLTSMLAIGTVIGFVLDFIFLSGSLNDMDLRYGGKLCLSLMMALSFVTSYISLLCQYDTIHETAKEISVLKSKIPEEKIVKSLLMVTTSYLSLIAIMLVRLVLSRLSPETCLYFPAYNPHHVLQ